MLIASKWPNSYAPRPKGELAKGDTKVTSKLPSKPQKGRSWDTRCFKCQGRGHINRRRANQRAIIILPNAKILPNDEAEYEGMPSLMDKEDELGEKCSIYEEVELRLVARRALTA